MGKLLKVKSVQVLDYLTLYTQNNQCYVRDESMSVNMCVFVEWKMQKSMFIYVYVCLCILPILQAIKVNG